MPGVQSFRGAEPSPHAAATPSFGLNSKIPFTLDYECITLQLDFRRRASGVMFYGSHPKLYGNVCDRGRSGYDDDHTGDGNTEDRG